eukprot:GEMP01015605.1.p1 GENE.GEMP01015605.1~~GEMP01015605.1.p1  ORF type:complete len:260 (+),score=69.05 GEMP01015605.1:24-803(+)
MEVVQALHRTLARKANVVAAHAGSRSPLEFGQLVEMIRVHGSSNNSVSVHEQESTRLGGERVSNRSDFRRALRALWGTRDDVEIGFAVLRHMSERIDALEILPCHYEQQNKDLEDLFEQLQQVDNARDINDTLQKIWAVWKNHPDEEIREDFKKASENLKAKNVSEAQKNLDNVIRLDPNYAEAFNQRAMILYMNGMNTEAMQDLHAALLLEPRHIVALSGLAKIHREQLNFPEEKETLKKILELCPNDDVVKNRIKEL